MATTASQPSSPQLIGAANGLAVRCAGGLASVPQADWDALVPPGSTPLKHGYLRGWERVELSGLRSRPVIAYATDSPAPVAACPGYFYDLDVGTVRNPQFGQVVRAIRRLLPRFLYARTYELGSPAPLTNPFLVADAQLRPRAVPALVKAGLEEANRGGADFTLVQNFTSPATAASEQLAQLGFARVSIPATAVLGLPYQSFDEYLGAMRAQYRRRAYKTLKHSSGLTAELQHEFEDVAEELARLWRSIYDRATEVKREVLTPAYFRAVSRLRESSVLMMRRRDGSIASFALLLDDRPWLTFLQCGFEADSRSEGAYFRLLYEIARVGIEGGYRQVDLGMTTLTPKLDVGAVPIALFGWLKHRNPVLQRIILAVGNGLLRPPRVEPRRVFKEAPASAAELIAERDLLR